MLHTTLKRRGHSDNKFNLVIFTESAEGLLNLKDICEQGRKMSSNFKICGIVFGSDDFVANIGEYSSNIVYHSRTTP